MMDVEEGALRQQLLCLKNKQRQLKWDGGKDMTSGGCATWRGGVGVGRGSWAVLLSSLCSCYRTSSRCALFRTHP